MRMLYQSERHGVNAKLEKLDLFQQMLSLIAGILQLTTWVHHPKNNMTALPVCIKVHLVANVWHGIRKPRRNASQRE